MFTFIHVLLYSDKHCEHQVCNWSGFNEMRATGFRHQIKDFINIENLWDRTSSLNNQTVSISSNMLPKLK